MPYSAYAEESGADGMTSGTDGTQPTPPQSDESMQDYDEQPRKLAVLGLPWDTRQVPRSAAYAVHTGALVQDTMHLYVAVDAGAPPCMLHKVLGAQP
jgi:hypothetical protein